MALALLAFVIVQRIAELVLSARNTRRLRAAGAVEAGAGHYPLFVLLHGAWLGAMALSVNPDHRPEPVFLILYGLLVAARVWMHVSLGRFWTTRIITLPGAALVCRGPYRWLRHPNYLIVSIEIVVVPLCLGLWAVAAAFVLPNLALIWYRIGVEEAALADRAASHPRSDITGPQAPS